MEASGLVLGRGPHAPSLCSEWAVNQVTEVPNLDPWPILTCWPEDGGRFFTLPLVITQSPRGRRNVGMYRLHVYDEKTTGMHMQIERGRGSLRRMDGPGQAHAPWPWPSAATRPPSWVRFCPCRRTWTKSPSPDFCGAARAPGAALQRRGRARRRGIHFGRPHPPANGGRRALRRPFRTLQPRGALPGVPHRQSSPS
ncbi:MAG: UbiD family decarboxylase [Elusimicrobia bacterium]|nr:UbiD family decarboxylase [Elusimicrobiota bacterium]